MWNSEPERSCSSFYGAASVTFTLSKAVMIMHDDDGCFTRYSICSNKIRMRSQPFVLKVCGECLWDKIGRYIESEEWDVMRIHHHEG